MDTSSTGDGSGEVTLATYDGAGSGTASFVLVRGSELPSAPGPVYIRFRFNSDGVYSDEDGMYETSCGAFSLDNILVRNTEYGGGID